MNELLVTLMLIVPSPDKMIDWTINEVPNQVQIVYKTGLEASFSSKLVPCNTEPTNPNEIVFQVQTNWMQECYLVLNWKEPMYVRHPNFWLKVKEIEQYENE
jgi:hypothetical protein